MNERFTDEARQTLITAQSTAHRLWHEQTDTEHLLLELSQVPSEEVGGLLAASGLTPEFIEGQIIARSERGPHEPAATRIAFAPAASAVIEGSLREARQLGASDIGTEHLLLGLVTGPEDSTAREIISAAGADAGAVAEELRARLADGTSSPSTSEPASRPAPPAAPPAGPDFRSGPDAELARVLQVAAGHALAAGRSRYGIQDVTDALASGGQLDRGHGH